MLEILIESTHLFFLFFSIFYFLKIRGANWSSLWRCPTTIEVKVSQGKFNLRKRGWNQSVKMRSSVCVRVPLRNDFLKDKGPIQAKSPTTKRYTQVLDQINAKVSQILTKEKKKKNNTKAFSKPLLGTNLTHMRHKTNKRHCPQCEIKTRRDKDNSPESDQAFRSCSNEYDSLLKCKLCLLL